MKYERGMSWVPIMASLRANLKEIKRPTTPYIATRQMNCPPPPLSNWNPLFVQHTSVSAASGCDIIDSAVDDVAVHNCAWPAGVKTVTWDKKKSCWCHEKSSLSSFVGDGRWTHDLAGYPLRDLAKCDITAGLIRSAAYIEIETDEDILRCSLSFL